MAWRWDPAALCSVCVLPAAAVREHIGLASPLQWRVLLQFAADGDAFDLCTCAKVLHKPIDAVGEALQYWKNAGILIGEGEPAPKKAPAPAEEPETSPSPVARPQPVKPQMAEVLQKQKEDETFSNLLFSVSARFGKPITPGNMETLLYLYDTAGIPADVILLVVAYAVARGKINMRYVETVALSWLDDGINTLPAAEEYLRILEQKDDAAARVRRILGRARELDSRSRNMAHTWLYVWNMSEELVTVALRYAVDNGKPPVPYANAILADWHENGITDPEEAKKALTRSIKPAAKRRAQTEESSLDLKGYEQLLEDYVPSLPADKEKS